MHHGGLGYIDAGKLYLPEDLLGPLSITRESVLFGLYYPPPASNQAYSNIRFTHDFMITPVPPRLWPKIGRMIVRLKHKPSMTNAISEFFAEKDVTILLTESSRSGHRYATWNLTLSFDNLDPDKLTFDNEKSLYIETYGELRRLKNELEAHCKEFLFTDFSDYYMVEPIRILPDTTLSYFHQQTATKKNNEWYFQVFKLACDDDGVIEGTQGELFEAILDHISTPENIDSTKFVFANMNTNDMNIRLVIIPPEEEKRFSIVTFDYKRSGTPDTTRGIIAHLTKHLPSNYNIWNLTTRTKVSTVERERGSTTMILENQSDSTNYGRIQLENDMQKVCQQPLPDYLRQIKSLDVNITTASHFVYQRALQNVNTSKPIYRFDVFLSYSSRDQDAANMIQEKLEKERIRCYMASKDLNKGDVFSDEIKKAFIDSREVCLLFSPNSAESDWVKKERGAAWILEKRIVPVLYNFKIEHLPEELKTRQACEIFQLDHYISELKIRREDSGI